MYPRARLYGWRYYYDPDFRARMKNREVSKRTKRKYTGSAMKKKKAHLYFIQSGQCADCKERLPYKQLTVDHIVSLFRGGTHAISNLQLLCVPCHNEKNKYDQPNYKVPHDPFANRPFEVAFSKLNERQKERQRGGE